MGLRLCPDRLPRSPLERVVRSARCAGSASILTLLAAGLLASAAAAQDARPHGLGEVSLTVAPYGDVFVDGRLVAKNATKASVWVSPGIYDVEVRNPWSKPEHRRLLVPSTGADVVVRLEPLPALLVVVTNVDASVRVRGAEVGRSWTSELAPLSVHLAGWRARGSEWVVVERDGYQPVRVRAHLEAGTTTQVEVKLERCADTPRTQGMASRSRVHGGGTFFRSLGL